MAEHLKNITDLWHKQKGFVYTCMLVFCILNVYFFRNYEVGTIDIEKITLESNLRRCDIVVYTASENDFRTDYLRPISGTSEGALIAFDLGGEKTRSFKMHIGLKSDTVVIKNVIIHYNGKRELLDISDFERHGIYVNKSSAGTETTFSSDLNGYFKLKRNFISYLELLRSEIIIFIAGILISLLIIFSFQSLIYPKLNFPALKKAGVYFFLASIYLPHPVFNIAFMLSFVLIVKDFNLKRLKTNYTGLLFLTYFIVFILNNFFLSENFNKSLTETLLPVLFLPFYFACVPASNYLRVFPVTGFLLSIFFFATSLIDASIFLNANYFSFDAFTKYLHPVYFSYLLLFSIIYIVLRPEFFSNKNILLTVLLLALIFCGSKLIVSAAILFFAIKVLRRKIYLGLAVFIVLIGSVLLFSPTKKRFEDIMNIQNLSILKDNPIESIHDPRLNGLTLRLIIWQESLNSLESWKEIFFGKGVDESSDDFLKNKLRARGLESGHTKYDPHNQFIATLYKFGLLGLSVLLLICIYGCYTSVKTKNEVLLYVVILFILVMLTESILQRVVGINFFISILLLLSVPLINPSENFENSDNRNKGNSK